MRNIDFSYRRSGLYMAERDFRELYTYLELFYKTYTASETEVRVVLDTIADIYAREHRQSDPEKIMKALHNPRNAGRKPKLGVEETQCIHELARLGYSIRKISEETGIPRSTIQRKIRSETSMSHN